MGHHAVVVHGGIAHVDADGINPATFVNPRQFTGGSIQCLFPTNGLPLVAAVGLLDAFHRLTQAIRVLVNILQGDGFRTDMTAAKRVIFVTLYRNNLAVFDFNFEATDSFAQMAGPIVSSHTLRNPLTSATHSSRSM